MTRDADFTSIVTERLRLRRFSPGDVEAFHAYRADPGVARYQSWSDFTREQAEELAATVRGSRVEAGGELVWEVAPHNPFAWFGGLGGSGTPL